MPQVVQIRHYLAGIPERESSVKLHADTSLREVLRGHQGPLCAARSRGRVGHTFFSATTTTPLSLGGYGVAALSRCGLADASCPRLPAVSRHPLRSVSPHWTTGSSSPYLGWSQQRFGARSRCRSLPRFTTATIVNYTPQRSRTNASGPGRTNPYARALRPQQRVCLRNAKGRDAWRTSPRGAAVRDKSSFERVKGRRV